MDTVRAKFSRTSRALHTLRRFDFIYFRHSFHPTIEVLSKFEINEINGELNRQVSSSYIFSLLLFSFALSPSLSQFGAVTLLSGSQCSVINIFCWQVVVFVFCFTFFYSFSCWCCCCRWCRTAPASASVNPEPNRTAPHRAPTRDFN